MKKIIFAMLIAVMVLVSGASVVSAEGWPDSATLTP